MHGAHQNYDVTGLHHVAGLATHGAPPPVPWSSYGPGKCGCQGNMM